MAHLYIQDIQFGQEVEGCYVLRDGAERTTSAGKPFFTGVLADMTGKVDAIFWDYTGPVTAADSGKIVWVRGRMREFKGNLQIALTGLRPVESWDHYDPADLLPTAPIDLEAALREVQRLVSTVEDPDYRKVAEVMLERHRDTLRTIPAAKTVHHSFLGGLLMHTAMMMRAADGLARLYNRVIDRSLLLTGTLLHDLAKREEFTFSELGLVTEYSLRGQLLGHLVMGAQEVANLCTELALPEEKNLLLQHLILSHHGQPEHGAAVKPQCAEAELLYYVDLIDSRMEIYAETFQELPAGCFSDYIFPLEKKIYKHN